MAAKASILIVANDHDTRVALRNCLEAVGHTVISAALGRDAIQQVAKINGLSLLILAMDLPVMSGAEFMATIRSDKELSRIPVIQIISEDTELLNGIAGTIQRSFEPKALVELIDKCLGNA